MAVYNHHPAFIREPLKEGKVLMYLTAGRPSRESAFDNENSERKDY